MERLRRISPREAYAAYVRGHLLVDVREPANAAQKTIDIGHLITMPISELNQRFSELPTNRPIVLVSRVGNSSDEAARFLLNQGYSDVTIVEGGLTEWEKEGLPVRQAV
ncbi:MAG: rhodanese-like domain-containing protein [Lewinellaceae bacterium]|nr:rhodanese-like domain-containing protein [Saprospiraceae bacterium]MCB9315873.1 rhodanese-like domain-containing protein [Lewinellaceae bacterium]MCB9330598.1 rhodanese-like domain-containing protein [Lewinellaceae bacterium]